MKKFQSLILFLFVGQLLLAQNQPVLFQKADAKKMEHWVDSVFNTMSQDEKIGQLFMLTASPDASFHDRILKNIREQKIGGLLFSGGKLKDQAASTNLYQQASRIPLLISFDGEWGLAMRLKEDTPLFPHNMMLGAIQDNELIRLYGEDMGRQCRELGVHINFAPVLDINNNPANPVIGNRSFGEDRELVSEKGIAYSKGLESQNVIAVGKHFPGHGDTAEDSHNTLPRINHDKDRIEEVELYPFVNYINAGFAGMMTGHLSIPALDSKTKLPTSLSSLIVNDLLKKDLGFEGLAITDALAMKGASIGKHSICVQALLAGNDILLNPTKPATEFEAVKKALKSGVLSTTLIEEKCKKVLRYKYIAGLNQYKPIEEEGLKERINTDYTEWLIQKLNNEAVTLLKNKDKLIPLNGLGDKKIAVLSIGENKQTSFSQRLSLYGDFDHFFLSAADFQSSPGSVFKELNKYDRIICEIHTSRISENGLLQSLAKEKEMHLCFFISPYSLRKFLLSISAAESVTLAYESTKPAQIAAVEILMGGIPAKGKLPVTIRGLFEYGTGLDTEKVRLSYQSPYEVGMSIDSLNRIEEIVNEGIQNHAFPGCQILIAKTGVVVYNRSFGSFDYSGDQSVKNTDIYDLASLTKVLGTLTALMKLYDEDKIALTSKISESVPLLRNTDKKSITVRDALFHESRLPAFLPFYQGLIDKDSFEGRLYSSRPSDIFHVHYDKDTYMRSDFRFYPEKVSSVPKPNFEKQVAENFYVCNDLQEELITEIANASLRRRKTYLYSDLNFILLKEVIENKIEKTLDNYLDSLFWKPLGANYMGFLPLKRFSKNQIVPTENDQFFRKQLLIGYPHDEAAAVFGGVSGNAGLFSNANDIAKVLQMLLYNGKYGGERYLEEETVKLFTTAQSSLSRRGLGFDRPDPDPKKSYTCESAPLSSFGHTGFTGTSFWVDPKNQLIYVFLSNRVYPTRRNIALMQLNIRPRIQEIIYNSIEN
ncbi:serine hydrolase [Bacteroidales bacterium OttesenSCG-928-A17]|nr:serine hydrolase [Bacteroidales bacterium OttesenSCG-928-A17]